MDKANALNRARISSKFINQLSILTNGNLSKVLQAITEVFGVVSEKQSDGGYDSSLKIEQNTPTSLSINVGYAISNNDGVVGIILVTAKDVIDVSSLLNNVRYNVYIQPKITSYEKGTVAFTNGSNMLAVTGGDFSKLSPYESIVIDTSTLGNNGVYEIYNVISSSGVQLVNSFTGTSESALKWQIVGNFKGYKIASKDDLIYSYDGYDVIVSSESLSTGFALASFEKNAGVIQLITDRRSENLYTTKAIGKVLADSVITGVTNAITTIEEKASAATIDKIIAENIQDGYRTGLDCSIEGDVTLVITAGSAYTNKGKRILTTETRIDLPQAVSDGNINEGDNYLYLDYQSPNKYVFQWSSSGTSRDAVLIASLNYNTELRPPYSVASMKNHIKHNVNSLVFQAKSISNYLENELYLRAGILYYQQYDVSVRPPVLKEIEILNLDRFNTLLDETLNTVAKSERLRFSLYPTVEKDSWFFNNGIQSPILLGYSHKIVSWKIGTLSMGTPAGTEHSYEYTTKVVLPTSKITNIITQTIGRNGNPDATIGVYFYGSGSENMIQLIYEGNVIAQTNMVEEGLDTLGQAVINKLYQVEVVLESLNTINTPILSDT